ncbi:MAG: HAD family hydrolase [Thermoplasmata archaeon]|nr:HAD family hydrolase [Thermoplasmata archaeon]
MKRFAAVTFDLWDTLIQEYPGGAQKVAKLRVRMIGDILASRGLAHSGEEIKAAYDKTGDFLALTWGKARDMPVRDQVLFMATCIDDKLGSKLSGADLAEIERAYVESTLADVKSSGYKLGLISNTGRTPGSVLRTILRDMGILEFFDVTTFSNEILVRKPAEGAFRTTLEKLKVVPRAAVHVGDDVRSDVAGAKQAGMKAVQVALRSEKRCPDADGYTTAMDTLVETIEGL